MPDARSANGDGCDRYYRVVAVERIEDPLARWKATLEEVRWEAATTTRTAGWQRLAGKHPNLEFVEFDPDEWKPGAVYGFDIGICGPRVAPEATAVAS